MAASQGVLANGAGTTLAEVDVYDSDVRSSPGSYALSATSNGVLGVAGSQVKGNVTLAGGGTGHCIDSYEDFTTPLSATCS